MTMKRVTGLVLALVILLGAVFPGAVKVSAASQLHASDECIRILKEEEGFCKYPIWDYSQWTVGYGSRCPDDMLNTYRKEGITEAEAETLLRNFLIAIENDLNTHIIDAHGLTLSQNQFDALVLFSYNCGTGWAFDRNGTLYKAVLNGTTGNELIRAFSLWCNAGGQIKDFLLRRRLSEANLYLNGIYDKQPPENYTFVIYEGNGGKVSPRVQGYDANLTAEPFPAATYDGYIFQGWFTERRGGTKVEKLDGSTKKATLYAQWLDSEGKAPESKPFSPLTIKVTDPWVNLREGPGTNYRRVGEVHKGDTLTITEIGHGSGYTWGKSEKGWIALEYTNYEQALEDAKKPGGDVTPPETTAPEETTAPTEVPETTEPKPTEPKPTEPETTAPAPTEKPKPTEPQKPAGQKGTVVNCTELRIRSGPSTGYTCVGYLKAGTQVTITEKKNGGGMIWGKIDKGWISLSYVDLEGEKLPSGGQTGTVVDCTELRIRSGPSTGYSCIGYLKVGTPVTIYEKKTNGSMVWGKIDRGWISLSYVRMGDSSAQKPADKPSDGGSTDNVQGKKGTVVNCTQLRIRSGPSTNYSINGYLPAGTKVVITEKKNNGYMVWGKISNGWISLDYVQMDQDSSRPEENLTGTVIAEEFLRIRSGPSLSYSVLGYMKPNERVTITQRRNGNGMVWGKTERGWISLSYVALDSNAPQSGDSSQNHAEDTSKTVIASCLNVRQNAGTSNPVVGYLYRGAKVNILETKDAGGMTWGRISNGWICMDYVK